MHISAAGAAVANPFPSNEKSTEVPPGLARRGLTLPPGITKKFEASGALPEGIAKRFPTVVTSTSTAPDISTTAVEELSVSLNITVAIGLDITV